MKDESIGFSTGMIGLLLIIPAVLFRAWVITMLWLWYIVPGFGAQPIHMAIVYGLSVLIALIIPSPATKDSNNMFVTNVVLMFLLPTFSLLLGWIGSFFV